MQTSKQAHTYMYTHKHTQLISRAPVSVCSGKLQLFQQFLSRNPILKWILSANHNYFVHALF